LLDNKESFNKVGISRNDEPTRFLTEEEMEQLEQARFNYETKVENTPKTTVEKNNKIKIEDIAPETKTKLTISQKTKNVAQTVKNVVRKILIVASFVIVAILGFYLAFSWNMPIDRDDEEVVKTEVREELKLDDKTDENNLDTQVSEKVETFEAKVDKAKQILGGLEEDIAQDKDLKENITDLKNSTQGFLDEHSDEISILKYRLENLINEFLK
jgi:predicted RND superfamily exporter protein